MKKILGLFIVLGLTATALGADGWMTDLKKAKKLAAKKNLPILINFSGSDWCKWCVKLDEEVFEKEEFKAYAKDNLVLFLADYPQKKKQSRKVRRQNNALREKYGVRGFPTLLLLDPAGNPIAKGGY